MTVTRTASFPSSCRFEAAKARPHDHDMRFRGRRIFHGAISYVKNWEARTLFSRRRPGAKAVVTSGNCAYLRALCRKPIARSKTRKEVSKRFKITGTGKVMRQQLAPAFAFLKKRKRKRHMPSPRKSTRPTRLGSSRTCRSLGADRCRKARCAGDLSRTVCLRQGLWTEDYEPRRAGMQQRSTDLLAVVLWRTFFWLSG